jgi:hypothetical protein
MSRYWRYKFCIHLRNLKVCHFGTVETMKLKIQLRGHLQWHDIDTEFHKVLTLGSKVSWEHKQ